MFPTWIQIVVGVVVAIISGGLLVYVLRKQDEKLEKKVDCAVCDSHREHIVKDLERGEESFKSLRSEIKEFNTKLGEMNALIAAIKQQIEAWIAQQKPPG